MRQQCDGPPEQDTRVKTSGTAGDGWTGGMEDACVYCQNEAAEASIWWDLIRFIILCVLAAAAWFRDSFTAYSDRART